LPDRLNPSSLVVSGDTGLIDIPNGTDMIRHAAYRRGDDLTKLLWGAMPKLRRPAVAFRRGALIVLLLSLALGSRVAMAADVATITIDGASQNVLFVAPASAPVAAVVMFPGGDGRIDVLGSGVILRSGNFLIRTQDKWLARGLLFVAVDAAAGRAGARGDRIGPANQRAIAEIVRLVRQRTKAPIWLVGTSAGAPAALAGAASLPPGAIRGVVISSAVTRANQHDAVFDVALAAVKVPVLIQVNRDDACRATPPADAIRIKAALTSAPRVEVLEYSGGDPPRSGPCEAFARHGFLGIEDQVVNGAANWIAAH
jgi:pimeloyl-ACP methyl ester carboxylesterase